MKQNKKNKSAYKKFLIGAAVLGIIAVGAAGTFMYKFNTSDATVAAGNQEFARQQYDAALQKYSEAQASAPIFAEPFYNAANVLYKQDKFEDAQKLLEQALTRTNDNIAEFLAYNLGTVAYNAQQFEQAITRYEDALRLNPGDKDAKYNLELALLQKQQQDQQQQNQDQQNQDQQNQDQQNQDQQNQDQQNQDQQNQDQQNQDQQNQDQQNQQDQQQQDGQQNQDQQDQQNGQQEQQQQGQQGQQDQQQQGQQDQQGQDSQNQQHGQQQQQDQQQQGNGAAGQPTDEQGQEEGYTYVPGELTQEQAEQLLAAVGGNSQTLLEKLQQYLYVPGGDPEKDW